MEGGGGGGKRGRGVRTGFGKGFGEGFKLVDGDCVRMLSGVLSLGIFFLRKDFFLSSFNLPSCPTDGTLKEENKRE